MKLNPKIYEYPSLILKETSIHKFSLPFLAQYAAVPPPEHVLKMKIVLEQMHTY